MIGKSGIRNPDVRPRSRRLKVGMILSSNRLTLWQIKHKRGAAAAFIRARVSRLPHAGGRGECLRGTLCDRRPARAIRCRRQLEYDLEYDLGSDTACTDPAGTLLTPAPAPARPVAPPSPATPSPAATSPTSAPADEPIGNVATLTGTATVIRNKDSLPLKLRDDIF